MNVKLVVVQGRPAGREIPLRIPKFLVGRGTECHLRPNSELISRHHCMFLIDSDAVVLRDLGSTNGTLVNGARVVGDVHVLHEDLIQLGPLGFRMVIESLPLPAPPRRERDSKHVFRPCKATSGYVGACATIGVQSTRDPIRWPNPGERTTDRDVASEEFDADSEDMKTTAESADDQDTRY